MSEVLTVHNKLTPSNDRRLELHLNYGYFQSQPLSSDEYEKRSRKSLPGDQFETLVLNLEEYEIPVSVEYNRYIRLVECKIIDADITEYFMFASRDAGAGKIVIGLTNEGKITAVYNNKTALTHSTSNNKCWCCCS